MIYRLLLLAAVLTLSSCSDDAPKQEKQVGVTKAGHELQPPVDRSKKEENTEVTPNPMVQQNKDLVAEDAIKQAEFAKIRDNDIVLGNREAPVVVIEYSSPTCPHCSYYHKSVLPEIRKKYIDTGKIAYMFREFVGNKQDLDASILGRCYKNEKDPLKLFDVIYIQQESWAFNKNYREFLGNIGMIAGISKEKFTECLNDKTVTMFLIENSRTISTIPGFIGTPTFFVDGNIHKGAYSVEGLSSAIEAALKSKKQESNQSEQAAEKGN